MARVREFDEQVALEQAMQLFWRQGYQAASLNSLLQTTSLSRSSFYETFGSKRELLLAALAQYAGSAMCGLAAPLFTRDAARPEIEAVFANMVEQASDEKANHGCFINNCTAELAQHDDAVQQAVRAARRGMEEQLATAVARGQRRGEIGIRETPEALGRFLANSLAGLNLVAKARPGKDVLDDVVRVSLSVLD